MDLLLIAVVVVGIFILRSYNLRLGKLESRVQELQNALAGRVLAMGSSESASAAETIDVADSYTEAAAQPLAETVAAPAVEAAAMTDDGETAPIHETTAPAFARDAAVSSNESLESTIGARWAVWVGGIALAFGGIFMVKYSIESGLLSPGVRLALAALFGLVLVAAGDVIRRRSEPVLANTFQNAMIPGVLTAAGVVALFGSTYAAHGIYGFIGPATAFFLLALISLATLGLSLLHGQALAGLGLLASMVTPA